MPPFHGRALIVHHQQFLDGERCNDGLQRRSAHDSPGRCRSDLYPGSRGVRQHRRALRATTLLPAPAGASRSPCPWSPTRRPRRRTRRSSPRSRRRTPARTSSSPSPTAPPATRAAPSRPGLPADFVVFSLETDMTRLVKAGIVDADWNTDEYKGIVTDSVVAIVTRKGNPKDIKDWDDLMKKGVEVITPNPFTSGGARWNIMAAYGAQIDDGKTEADGVSSTSPTCSRTSRCRTTAPARRCRPSPAARATSLSPTRTRRSSPSRTARTSTTSCPTRPS